MESEFLEIKKSHIENESYEKAIDHINELFNKYPTNAEIFDLLGREYQGLHKHSLAIECFAKAKKINPEQKGLELRIIFNALFVIKNEGLENLNRYDIDEKLLYEIRATYYYHAKLYKKAIAELKKSIEINPTEWSTYRDIAENYQKIGEVDEALSFYDKALSTDSIDFEGKIEVLFGKSRLYLECGKFKDASIALHNLVENSVEDVENYLYSLFFLHSDDEYDELIEISTLQIDRNPKDIYAITCKGIMLLLKRELEEAKTNFSTAISLSPKNPASHFCYGITSYLLGESEIAIQNILSASGLDFANTYYIAFYKLLKKELDS